LASIPSNMAFSSPEAKVDAAVQLAQDPDSVVSSDVAEKEIVQQSKRAGVPAFEFDPDASPEQKAAQARAVSDPVASPTIHTDIWNSTGRARRFPPSAQVERRCGCNRPGRGGPREICPPRTEHRWSFSCSIATQRQRGEARHKWSCACHGQR